MDAQMSNDSGDLCHKYGNGIKTGMRFDIRVRRTVRAWRVCICRLFQ